MDLWYHRGLEGQSLKKALDFIAPYADADETCDKLIGKLPADKVATHHIRLKTSAVLLGLSKETEKN